VLKRAILISLIFIVIFKLNIYGDEMQLTDYDYTYAKRMFDGYNYVSCSDSYGISGYKYDKVETNIIKPNGTLLVEPATYNIIYEYLDESTRWYFPQSESGNIFLVRTLEQPYIDYDIRNNIREAFVDSEGNQLCDYGFVGFTKDSLYVQYTIDEDYLDNKGEKTVGIINTKTKEKIETQYNKEEYPVFQTFIDENNHNFVFLFMEYSSKKDNLTIKIDFYENFNKVNSYSGIVTKENNDEYKNDVLLFKCNTGKAELIYKDKHYYYSYSDGYDIDETGKIGDMSYIKMNYDTKESESDRVDKSYVFKEKKINGTTYYALFKELKDGETAANFTPTENPNEKYADNIEKMTADKLLFNNELCFFDKGITKLDFGIVLGRAYCDAVGYSIDNFTSDTHFADVNTPYCLLLADKGILGSDTDLYINEKAISQATVLNSLDEIAKKYGILSRWNEVKEIEPSEKECTRELAYSEVYKLYNILKELSNANINTDFRNKSVDYNKVVGISLFSVVILVVGTFLNNTLIKRNI